MKAAEDSLRRAEVSGCSSTLALAHFAFGHARLAGDPTRAAASYEEALRFGELGGSNMVRDRSVQTLGLIAWRSGDATAAARHLARSLSETFAMGDYANCAYTLEIVIPTLAAGGRWHAAVAIDHALTNGTLFAPVFNFEDIAEARERAIADSRAMLGAAAGEVDTSRDRDAIIRYAIAELETLAEV